MDEASGEEMSTRNLTLRILTVNFAAIHTSSMVHIHFSLLVWPFLINLIFRASHTLCITWQQCPSTCNLSAKKSRKSSGKKDGPNKGCPKCVKWTLSSKKVRGCAV
jgi:hypothetical protein